MDTIQNRLLRVAEEIERECPISAEQQGVIGMLHTIAAAIEDPSHFDFLSDIMRAATMAILSELNEKIAKNN